MQLHDLFKDHFDGDIFTSITGSLVVFVDPTFQIIYSKVGTRDSLGRYCGKLIILDSQHYPGTIEEGVTLEYDTKIRPSATMAYSILLVDDNFYLVCG